MYVARFLLLCALALVVLRVGAVDLNQASMAELQQIKGIGPKTSERIIEERTRGGPFDSLQDLSDRVKGIGPKRLVALEASGLKISKSVPLNSTPTTTEDNL